MLLLTCLLSVDCKCSFAITSLARVSCAFFSPSLPASFPIMAGEASREKTAREGAHLALASRGPSVTSSDSPKWRACSQATFHPASRGFL